MKKILFTNLIWICVISAFAQPVSGRVVDERSGEPLPYVRIGIEGKNAGTISHESGEFSLSIAVGERDSVTFSMLGYERKKIHPLELSRAKVVKLRPRVYSLDEVIVSADEIIELKKLGRPEATKTTIGHRGTTHWGTGGEWGVQIPVKKERYRLHSIAFHTRFNSLDSVLFRLHVYSFDGSRPDTPLLANELYVKSYRKNKWIVKDVKDLNIIVSSDFVVTMEIVRLWYKTSAPTDLFFTYGENPQNLTTFSRESSLAQWDENKMPPLALYATARKLDE